jgi:hypothetical protein
MLSLGLDEHDGRYARLVVLPQRKLGSVRKRKEDAQPLAREESGVLVVEDVLVERLTLHGVEQPSEPCSDPATNSAKARRSGGTGISLGKWETIDSRST